jgi:hypothetical protein
MTKADLIETIAEKRKEQKKMSRRLSKKCLIS